MYIPTAATASFVSIPHRSSDLRALRILSDRTKSEPIANNLKNKSNARDRCTEALIQLRRREEYKPDCKRKMPERFILIQ